MASTISMPSGTSGAATLFGAQSPRISHVPEYVSSAGQEAIELAELAGLHLDPWEGDVLIGGCGERADGKWAAFEVGVDVPRQNGKGSILEARELAGAFLFGERLIIHSAHEQATSSEHFLRLLNLIEGVPEFDRRILKVSRGKGAEAIILRDGYRIFFKTRTGGGGRGLTGDLVVIDEAMMCPVAVTAALVPTMAARSIEGNPQLWYAGSAVDQQKHDHGVVFARLRQRGHERSPRVAWFEWSAAGEDPSRVPKPVRNDPATWAQANPGMGIRISAEHIADEHGALPSREFCVERLGIGDWPDTDEDAGRKIGADAWSACLEPAETVEPATIRPVSFAYDVSPNRSTAAIGAAGRRADGKWVVAVIEHGAGTDWIAGSLESLTRAHRPTAVGHEKAPAPAGSLSQELAGRKIRKLKPISSTELAEACGVFYDAVDQAILVHIGQPEFDDAIEGAGERTLGDGWAWARRVSTADITPLVACTIALYLAFGRRKKAGVINLAEALANAERANA